MLELIMEQMEKKKVNENDVTQTLDKDPINDDIQESVDKSEEEKTFRDKVNFTDSDIPNVSKLKVESCEENLILGQKENVSESLICDSKNELNENDTKETKSTPVEKVNSTQECSNNVEIKLNGSFNQSMKCNEDKTPEKIISQPGNKSPGKIHESDEQDMMSEIEQAKQLMAATEKYLQSLEKTPVKQMNPQNCQALSNGSPGTPGRHKRVNLVTLASPKAKKFRPDFN